MAPIRSLASILLGVFMALGVLHPTFAQEDALTAADVKGFISSYPEAKQLAQKYELDKRDRAAAGPRNEVFAGVLEEMKAAGAYDEFATLVRGHGFAGPEEWIDSANRIMMAYAVMAAEDSQGGGRMDENVAQQLAEARQQVESSDMPADQKQMALSQLEAMASQMKMFEVSEADRSAVRPHMAELDRIVETE